MKRYLALSGMGLITLLAIFAIAQRATVTVAAQSSQEDGNPSATSSVDRTANIPPVAPSRSAGLNATAHVLQDLKASHRPNGAAARIRLEGQLAETWDRTPPSSQQLVTEVTSTNAPVEYRTFLAQMYLKYTKRGAFTVADLATAKEEFISLLRRHDESPLVRGEVALVLADFDKSDSTADAVTALLSSPDDEAASRAATALRKVGTDYAAAQLFAYVSTNTAARDSTPNAYTSALMALTGYEKADIVPILKDTATTAKDIRVFQGALMCLEKAPSTPEVIGAIVAAHESASRFAPADQSRAKAMSIQVLRRHRSLFESKDGLDDVNATLMDKARTLMEGKPQ